MPGYDIIMVARVRAAELPYAKLERRISSLSWQLGLLRAGMKRVLLRCIRFYLRAISPFFPPAAAIFPPARSMLFQALEKYGAVKGSFLAFKRLLRCHPFHPQGRLV